MPKKQPQLAKLTRPRLHKAVARERLFALLDEAREHKPAIRVVGSTGSRQDDPRCFMPGCPGNQGHPVSARPGCEFGHLLPLLDLGEEAKPFKAHRAEAAAARDTDGPLRIVMVEAFFVPLRCGRLRRPPMTVGA